MRRKIFASFGIIVSALAFITASSVPAVAATAGSGNALRVSPVRTDLEIKPGNSKTIDVYVTNMSSETVTLHPIVNDFVAGSDESGTPNILLDNLSFPGNALQRLKRIKGIHLDLIPRLGSSFNANSNHRR